MNSHNDVIDIIEAKGLSIEMCVEWKMTHGRKEHRTWPPRKEEEPDYEESGNKQ